MTFPSDPLRRLLQDWQVRPSRSAEFRSRVWQRIERGVPASWPQYVRSHLLAWSAAAVLTILASGVAGHSSAKASADARREAMVVEYLTELDPRVHAILQR